jgi:tetratricopeptide (TPR) repeat protein
MLGSWGRGQRSVGPTSRTPRVRDNPRAPSGRFVEMSEGTEPVATEAATTEAAPRKRSRATRELQRGRVIGRYVVLDKLGAGGMGIVVAAYDPELDRKVAIKLLHAHTSARSDAGHRRLLAEAQALARLSDPNVVAVHDVGTHEGRVFVAMEFVEGRTLERWLALERRPWAPVLDVMIAAGRGLAAAHARDLVHRDFKPGNVMIGNDGRVRVMDFGLAFARGEPLSTEGPPSGSAAQSGSAAPDEPLRPRERALEQAITHQGSLLGTPAYMAPEQVAGGRTGPAADQFSFCVSLWEALYGQPPFSAQALPELFSRMAEGKLDEPPRSARVPRWLRRAVERGLSVDPERRWPSMTALLLALERGRVRGRFRGVAALGLLSAVGALLVATADEQAPCGGAEGKLEGIWDGPMRAAMATAFAGVDVPYAEDARASAERTLDAHAARWVELHAEICEATRVRGDQSEALMDQRIGCLDAELRDMAALTAVLVKADAEVVRNAAQAARALDSLDECVTLERDVASQLRPEDPALAAVVADVREQTAHARALGLAGKYDEGVAVAQGALEAARASGYEPVIAEAAAMLGDLHDFESAPLPARDAYEEALHAALATGHGRIEAQALIGLSSVWGRHLNDTEAALRYSRQADAVMKRLGSPPELAAAAALRRGNTLMHARRLEAATLEFERTVELTHGVAALERLQLVALNNLATAQAQQGHLRQAAEVFARVAEIYEARLGPWHPSVGGIHDNLGVTYSSMGEHERAMVHMQRALEIYGKTLSPDHPELGRGYHNLGVVQKASGDLQGAHASYERALRIKIAALGPDHTSVAITANNICDMLMLLGRHVEAIPHCERALAIWARANGEASASTIVPLVSLSQAQLAVGHPEAALSLARRALAVGESGEIDPVEIARARFAAARATLAIGGDPAQARVLAEQAKQGHASADQPAAEEIAEIEAWLADQR